MVNNLIDVKNVELLLRNSVNQNDDPDYLDAFTTVSLKEEIDLVNGTAPNINILFLDNVEAEGDGTDTVVTAVAILFQNVFEKTNIGSIEEIVENAVSGTGTVSGTVEGTVTPFFIN